MIIGQGATVLTVSVGWGCLDIFLSSLNSLFLSPALWVMTWYRLKYCLKEPLNPKLPTNPIHCILRYTPLQAMFIQWYYSLIQKKCRGSNEYALPITVKFDQSTRRFGRISFAHFFKLTKHMALLFYILSPYLLSCMRGSRNVRKNMHIIKTVIRLRYDKFWRPWDSNSVSQVCVALQRPIISKCQHSPKFGNTVPVKFSFVFANLCWLAK